MLLAIKIMSTFGNYRKDELKDKIEDFITDKLQDGEDLGEVLHDLHEAIGVAISHAMPTLS